MKETKKGLNLKKYILIVIAFICVCLFYPAGAIHSVTKIEKTSNYISSVSIDKGKVDVPVIVENKKEGRKLSLIDTASEFRYLYGVFGGGNKAYFASTVNADKKNSILCHKFGNNVNYSFLYAESGFSNKKQSDGDYYRHEFYPIKLMFRGEHRSLSGSFSFLYISKSQADMLLADYNLEQTKENYQSLLGTGLTLSMNGKDYLWLIEDIYLETGTYFNDLQKTIGDFFVGYREYPEGFKKQSTYFLNDSEYENKFFLEHIKTSYSKDDIILKFQDDRLNNDVLQTIYDENESVLSIIMFSVSLLCLAIVLVICSVRNYFSHLSYSLFFAGGLLFPWLIFRIIKIIFKNTNLFSTVSNSVFLIFFIVAEVFIVSFYVLKNFILKGKPSEKHFIELDI